MKKSNYRWILTVTLISFFVSLVMSLLAMLVLENVTLYISIIVTFLFIILGIIFDIIGVGATCANIAPFHSMASRKVKGGKIGVKLIKNASKVSSICCDVVGDICGIITGVTGVTIVTLVINLVDVNSLVISLLVTALISSLTIGGKAIGKNYAISKADSVILFVSKILSIFSKI